MTFLWTVVIYVLFVLTSRSIGRLLIKFLGYALYSVAYGKEAVEARARLGKAKKDALLIMLLPLCVIIWAESLFMWLNDGAAGCAVLYAFLALLIPALFVAFCIYARKAGKLDIEEAKKLPEPEPDPKFANGWVCASCGTANLESVKNCQGCGVTKQWSDSHKKD